MELTAQQIAYLVSLGLAEGAGDAQIKAFVATLGAGQLKFLNGLATPAAPASLPAQTAGSAVASPAAPAAAPA